MKFARSLSFGFLFSLICIASSGLITFNQSALASCDPPPETPKKPPQK